VPATELGLEQKIRVGPMSGRSNVVFWLERRGIEPTEPRVDAIFGAAKRSTKLLEDQEMLGLIQDL
jgi:2-isopropylmalate synthase